MKNIILENDILREFKLAYETLFQVIARIEDDTNTDKALATINLMATYAWHKHPGRFTDLRLEYWAAKIGDKIWKNNVTSVDSYVPMDGAKQRVLHVASETYHVGGHTRLLLNLIQRDPESVHSLVVIRQQSSNIPPWLREAVMANGGNIISLEAKSYTQQVAALQQIMCKDADKIFYHIHPNDSVAVAALAATPRPQVLTINHADHVFWLGSALSDVVVCFRNWALSNTMEYRNAQKAMLLPIPLNFAPAVNNFKQKARAELNIGEDKIIILTVASFYKFIPSGKYNYFKTLKRVIEHNSNALLKVVGVSGEDELAKIEFEQHQRIELLGVITNPQIYYEAADIYIDAMPVGSYTSLLEAMYFSCFPILQFCPIDTLNTENELATKGLVVHANDESEQINFIQKAIDDKGFRDNISSLAAMNIKDNYLGAGWKSLLKEIYQASSSMIYTVRSLKHELHEPLVITQLDNEAALLAHSADNTQEDILAVWINRNLHLIGFLEMIKLFLAYNFRSSKLNYNFSLKSLLWLIRKKLFLTIHSI